MDFIMCAFFLALWNDESLVYFKSNACTDYLKEAS